MVAKEGASTPSNNESSTPRGEGYLKRFQQRKPSNISAGYDNYDGRSPRSEATFDSPSYYDNESFLFAGNSIANGNVQTPSSFRPQRPQMTPRRVLHQSPKKKKPSSHPARPVTNARIPKNIRIDYTGQPVGPLKNPKAIRSPTRPPPPSGVNARKAMRSPRVDKKQKPSILANFRPLRSKDKTNPLLTKEGRDESNSRNQAKSSRNAPYRPPAINPRQVNRNTKEARVPTKLSSPMAMADAKRKAREMGQREPPQMAQSPDSENNDKYASSQKEDRYDSVYSQQSRDTYDETLGETADEELARDETFSTVDGKSISTKNYQPPDIKKIENFLKWNMQNC